MNEVEWREVDGLEVPTTSGEPVGDEPTVDGRRVWHPRRSKLAAALVKLELPDWRKVLYLGGGAGTGPSYVADVAEAVYAVEFARSPARRLVEIAETRPRLFPVVEDAREPERYRSYVEKVDFLYQDVATRGQAAVANANADYLDSGGEAWITVKARSEDVTREPGDVYQEVAERLEQEYAVDDVVELEPFYEGHAVVVAEKK